MTLPNIQKLYFFEEASLFIFLSFEKILDC